MKIKFIIFFLVFTTIGSAQFVDMSTTAGYTQSFDTLSVSGTWTNNATIKNWYAKKLVGSTQTNITTIALDNGNSSASNLYSYGTNGSADRALGGLTTDAQPTYAYGMLLRNTSGNPITNMTVAYTGEQWRAANTVAQDITFSYKISSTIINDLTPGITSGWVVVPALKFTSLRNTTIGLLNGNTAANRSVIPAVTIPALNIPHNSYIMIKWEKGDVSSGSNHPMAIDDVAVNWTTVPLCTGVTVTSVTPTAAPIGSEVTINAATGLAGATATFNGIPATVISSSPTKLVVVVPAGAATGNLIVTNAASCVGSPIHFDIIKSDLTSCLGNALQTNLFISEVTDSNYGAMTYVELYNNTGSLVALSNYSLRFAFNGNGYTSTYTFPSGATIANNATYVVAFRGTDICSVPGGNGSYANDVTYINAGINFTTGGHDHIGLFNSAGTTLIDSWGVFGTGSWSSGTTGNNGASFKRKNTATLPNTTYSNSDWDIIDFVSNVCANNDYTDIGRYEVLRSAPIVDTHPAATIVCSTKNIILSVTGTEGFFGPPGLSFRWYVAAPGATSFIQVVDNVVYSGSNTSTLTINNIDGLNGYQYYCQIREDLATCFTASNAYVIKEIPVSIYTTALGWQPIAPTSSRKAVFQDSYNTAAGNIEACRCEIKSGATVTIKGSYHPAPPSETYIELQRDLVNDGNLIIENNGSFIQVDDAATVTGSGITSVARQTTPYDAFDYTYWSAPTFEPNIGTTFPDMRTDHSYSWIASNFVDANGDGYDDAAPWAWHQEGPSATMKQGVGYIVRGSSASGTWPRTSNGVFTGVLNNGIIPVTTSMSPNPLNSNNLVGNPYASAISADDFIDLNTNIDGTLYFWTHVDNISPSNPGPYLSNFSSDDYAVYTKMGGTGTRGAILHSGHPVSGKTTPPTGKIASGQGFYVTMLNPTQIIFNNSLRSKSHANTDFFKTAGSEEKDRVWLDLYNEDQMFSQQLVGYADDATLGKDRGYDGPLSNAGNYINFYSMIGNEKFKIQGRSTFIESDEVPLGYFSAVDDVFKIAIDSIEGQLKMLPHIYLQDRELQIFHDLKQGPYSFVTEKGTFNNRFVLRYTNTLLGNEGFETNANNVLVATDDKIRIKSLKGNIQKIQMFDVLGRVIYTNEAVSQSEFTIENMAKNQSALIVKVTLENQAEVTKKILF